MRGTLVALCLIGGWPAVVAAQEPRDLTDASLEELVALPVDTVMGASKYLQKISDAPASVTIITSEEIRLYGYRTLADVLRSVRGVSISYDRNYSYLGLRGLSRPGDLNTRVLIIVDGHRLNDNVFDSALIGTEFPIDVDLIDRVEVIRGPGAALYGANAFSAVISVITRAGHERRGVEASAQAGDAGSRGARLSLGAAPRHGLDALLSASHTAERGQSRLFFPEFDDAATNNGVAERADADRSDRLFANVSIGALAAHAAYSTRLKHVPTASFGTLFNDSRTRTIDERGYLDLQYARHLGRRFDIIARGYWDRYTYDGWYVFGSDTGPSTVNRDFARGKWWGAEAALAQQVSTRDRLTLSAEYRRNGEQNQGNFDEAPASLVYLDDRRQSVVGALNVQNEWRATRQVLLNAALRYETTPSGRVLTPRVGIIVTPRAATTVKVLVSEGMRPPSVYERFYESPPNYASNPDLAAEEIDTVEAVFEQDVTPWIHLTGSVFANRYHDLIVPDDSEDGVVRFVNGLDANARGVEVGWNSRLRGGTLMRTSYAYLFGSDSGSGAWTSGAPRHLAKFNLAVPVPRVRTTAAIAGEWVGARQTHTQEMLGPVARVDLTLTHPVATTLDLQASIRNAFNARYSDPASTDHVQGAIQQDGRRFLMRLVWRSR